MSKHIRPYLVENTGSRPLSHSQAAKGLISSWVGDDQRIPAVVCVFFFHFFFFFACHCLDAPVPISHKRTISSVLPCKPSFDTLALCAVYRLLELAHRAVLKYLRGDMNGRSRKPEV